MEFFSYLVQYWGTGEQWYPTDGTRTTGGTWELTRRYVEPALEVPIVSQKEYEYIYISRNDGHYDFIFFLYIKPFAVEPDFQEGCLQKGYF